MQYVCVCKVQVYTRVSECVLSWFAFACINSLLCSSMSNPEYTFVYVCGFRDYMHL